MSLDMRMVSGIYEDHPDNKASHCAANIAKVLQPVQCTERNAVRFLGIWEPTSRANGMCTPKLNASSWKTTPYLRTKSGLFRKRKMISNAGAYQWMNEGKIRVLFGSTSMLGTGVNAQKEPLPFIILGYTVATVRPLLKGMGGIIRQKATRLPNSLPIIK